MKLYQEKEEADKIHHFLLGLNETFYTLRTQILSLDNLPSMNKVFGLVIQEEKQRSKFRESTSEKLSESAFYAKKETKNPPKRTKGMYAKNDKKLDKRFYCDNCKYYGHTRDKCYHLVGKPKFQKKNQSKKEKTENEAANQVAATTSKPKLSLTQDEIQLFKDFIASNKTNNSGNIYSFSFNVNSYIDRWIVDTGAFQHMTGNLHLFTTPPAKESNHFFTIPSGKILLVKGVGSIKISENLIPKNVLFIP